MPFSYNQRQKSRSNSGLRYYPLIKGRQAVGNWQAGIAQNQRGALAAPPELSRDKTPPTASRAAALKQAWQSQQEENPPGMPGRQGMQSAQGMFNQSHPGMPVTQGANSPFAPAMPAAPAVQSQPVDPAERLRSLNKNLPDGVHYEPLDAKTLQQLQASRGGSSKAQQQPPQQQPVQQPASQVIPQQNASQPFAAQAAPPQSMPPQPVLSNAASPHSASPAPHDTSLSEAEIIKAESIERLIQDERNAHVFYTHLATLSPRSDFSAILNSIADGCSQRMDSCSKLLNGLYERTYAPAETAVNTPVSFDEGVALAVREENKTLRSLADMQAAADAKAAGTLQQIINRKLVDHNILHFMVTETRSFK